MAPAAARRLRVLYLSWRDLDNPEAGGAEVFTERTSQVMADRGHEVTLFTARFPGAQAEVCRGGVRLLRGGGRFTCYLRGLAHLHRNRGRYDVVVDVQNGVPFWSPLVARVPVVNITHHLHRDQWDSVFGSTLGRIGWFLESRVAPWVYRNSRYVAVSEATRQEMADIGVDPERVTVIYSGNDQPADLQRFDLVPRTPHPSIAVLGRLVPHKHIETAIDIVADLATHHPDIRLEVVGTGYWHDELVAHTARRGVSERVTFHGFVDEVTKHTILARSWLMLMPSRKEGWGLTIVEAGLHGTPTVAFSQAGGPRESIRHAETGLLAEDDADMRAHVEALLSDGDLRAKYGDNARRYAASFDWTTAGTQLGQLLERLTAGAA